MRLRDLLHQIFQISSGGRLIIDEGNRMLPGSVGDADFILLKIGADALGRNFAGQSEEVCFANQIRDVSAGCFVQVVSVQGSHLRGARETSAAGYGYFHASYQIPWGGGSPPKGNWILDQAAGRLLETSSKARISALRSSLAP